MVDTPTNTIEVFYSYSYAPRDEALRNELEKHLSGLQRQGIISGWHRRSILASMETTQEIETHLDRASLILLLISPDFMASDYCYGIEMQRAMTRHEAKEARVIPVISRRKRSMIFAFNGTGNHLSTHNAC